MKRTPRLLRSWRARPGLLLLGTLVGIAPAHAQAPPVGDAAPAAQAPPGAGVTPASQEGDGAGGPVGEGGAPQGQQARGVMVRLETAGAKVSGTASVTLTPTDGAEPLSLELKDDGQPPDVTAADGTFAAATLVQSDAFGVTLAVGDTVHDGGEIAWDAAEGPARDLVIRLSGDGITLSAGTHGGGAPSTDPSAAPLGAAPLGAAPSGPGAAPLGAAPLGAESPTVSRDDALLWLAIGVGLVGLAITGLLISRGMGARKGPSLTPLREPGLLGPRSPSLSDGPSRWVIDPAEREALLSPLVDTVARHHRVLLITPAGVHPPDVRGGPAYHVGWDVDLIGDAADELVEGGGAPLAAVIVAPDASPATVEPVLEALPEGVGAIIIVPSAPPEAGGPSVHLAAAPGGATLRSAGQETPLRHTNHGFEAPARA